MTIEPKAQHAPIRISPDDPVVIETESGEFFATTLPYDGDLAFAGDYERAEFIVRAVNSHAALVEALEQALIFTMSMHSIFADANFTDRYDDAGRCENMIKTIDTALPAGALRPWKTK